LLGGDVLWLLLRHVLPRSLRRLSDGGLLPANTQRLIQRLQRLLQVRVDALIPCHNTLSFFVNIRCLFVRYWINMRCKVATATFALGGLLDGFAMGWFAASVGRCGLQELPRFMGDRSI
jgi:hypothetical protein